MPVLPYGWLPRHWGAKGKQRDIEKANYELTGEELDRRLAEINHSGKNLDLRLLEIDRKYEHISKREYDDRRAEIEYADDEQSLALAKLAIQKEHGEITQREYEDKEAEVQYSNDEMGLSLALLANQKAHGEITEPEYEKGVASIKGEEWIGIISYEYNPSLGKDGFSFEFDWNSKFVEMLRANGYNGRTEEQVVEQWFEDVSTTEYMRMLNEMAMDGEVIDDSIPSTVIHHVRTDDGKKIYS